MRWLVLLAACGSGGERPILVDAFISTRLDLNVLWTPELFVVFAREPARPCTCLTGKFPTVDTCVDDEDVLQCTCDPPPAACLTPTDAPIDLALPLGVAHVYVGHAATVTVP